VDSRGSGVGSSGGGGVRVLSILDRPIAKRAGTSEVRLFVFLGVWIVDRRRLDRSPRKMLLQATHRAFTPSPQRTHTRTRTPTDTAGEPERVQLPLLGGGAVLPEPRPLHRRPRAQVRGPPRDGLLLHAFLTGPYPSPPSPLTHPFLPHPSPPTHTHAKQRLEEAGYGVGHRVLELLSFRDKQYKRETKLIGILQVRACLWGSLWGGARGVRNRWGWLVINRFDWLVDGFSVSYISIMPPYHATHPAASSSRQRCGGRSSTRWRTLSSAARRTRTSVRGFFS
jgi:hypothetical protein